MLPIIFVIGNMASGKSTVGKYLSKILKVPFTSLDDCRKLYGNGQMSGEYLAWSHFLEQVEEAGHTGGIFECTGAGQHVRHLKFILKDIRCNALSNKGQVAPMAEIVLECNPNTCLHRHRTRLMEKIPFPYQMEPQKIIDFIDKEMDKAYFEYQLGITNVLKVDTTNSNIESTLRKIKTFLKEERIVTGEA